MRIMVFSADYPRFLRDLYLSRPGLAECPYDEQMAARNDSLFGVADFYSRNLIAHGHEAAEFHINNPWLQYAWARENGLKILPLEPSPDPVPNALAGAAAPSPALSQQLIDAAKTALRPARRVLGPLATPVVRRARRWHRERQAQLLDADAPRYAPDRTAWEHEILRAQIEQYRPDLILNQELAYLPSNFFRKLKRPDLLLFGQIASSMPADNFAGYDMMISSLPNQVEWFRARGLRAELNRLACEPTVLAQMGPPPSHDIPLSFVGSLSPDHQSRIAFLEYLAVRTPLKVWGNGIERLPASSPLHHVYQGEAWGRQMYEIIRRSAITLNFHIDLSDGWANNLRLYEATLMGTLLLTDWKKNLHEMFVPGEHVASYQDAADCVRQIETLLGDDAMRARIAAAGQARAIATQTYFRRTGEIIALAQSLR